jgi:hypothetical protein
MIEREQPLAAAPPLFIGLLRKLLATGSSSLLEGE